MIGAMREEDEKILGFGDCVLKHPHAKSEKHYNAGKHHPFYGKHHSEKTKSKMSKSMMGENNPNYGKHTWSKGLSKETDKRLSNSAVKISKTRKRLFKEGKLKNWNAGLTKETDVKLKRSAEKIKKSWANEEVRSKQIKAIRKACRTKDFKEKMNKMVTELWKNEKFREKHSGKNHYLYGKSLPEETKIKISEAQKGEKSWNWQGGKSFEPYSPDFNYSLKEMIRERDGRRCQECGKPEGWRHHALHHIDYDKRNCNPINLITLCLRCNLKANYKREYWTNHFRGMMK